MLVASDRGTRSKVPLRMMALYSSLMDSLHRLSFSASVRLGGTSSARMAARPYFLFGLLMLFFDRVVMACLLVCETVSCVSGAVVAGVVDGADVDGVSEVAGGEESEIGGDTADVGAKEPASC